ncbi:DUF1801 domain-containing protein [Thalassotalea ganghwensis]
MNSIVNRFIENLQSDIKRDDCTKLVTLFSEATGFDAYLDNTIIGFGRYHYKYDPGREGDSIVTGFSPRKQNITMYIMPGFAELDTMLVRLGKHKVGKSCLYISKLDDIDTKVLSDIIRYSVEVMRQRFPCKNVR